MKLYETNFILDHMTYSQGEVLWELETKIFGKPLNGDWGVEGDPRPSRSYFSTFHGRRERKMVARYLRELKAIGIEVLIVEAISNK